MTGDIGSVVYMAPELIIPSYQNDLKRVYGKKIDVYSCGIILWEILVREKPYKSVKLGPGGCYLKEKIVNNSLPRPEIPKNCPVSFSKLISKCWSQMAKDRPNMRKVQHRLFAMEGEVKAGLK